MKRATDRLPRGLTSPLGLARRRESLYGASSIKRATDRLPRGLTSPLGLARPEGVEPPTSGLKSTALSI